MYIRFIHVKIETVCYQPYYREKLLLTHRLKVFQF